MQNTPRTSWQFWIDRGGTFTDIVAHTPTGTTQVHKLLSENPDRYEDAPLQGIRDLMGIADNQPIPTEQIDSIKMGTTVATNALLERKGDRTLFITTQGFADGLRIGYQNRPDIFARQIILPEMLYEQVIEVPERLSASGEVLQAITAEAQDQLRSQLQQAYDSGIHSCAIAFLHSYRYPQHEQQIATLAQQVGFSQISVSHQVSPLIKWVSRSDTTVVDAYLSPILRRYVNKLEQTLSPQKADPKKSPKLLFMQSNGGLIPAQQFQGKDSILSGPAGGIVGAVQTSRCAGFDKIITFDMGGTSTDVAHYQRQTDASTPNYERVYETEVAGVRLRSPMMAIHTVAAGGGSVLSFTDSRYQVGPESAGAHPGPACYRNGGPLTVTDCNVMVGKLQPDFFPQVFGARGDQPIDRAVVQAKFEQMGRAIAQQTGETKEPEAIADGFLAIATDNMANAIKKISVQKGYDITDYALCCFGAAGGQHACRLADSLGMKTVFIHPYAGVLSAYGMGLAERRVLKEQSVEVELEGGVIAHLTTQIEALAAQAIAELNAEKDSSIQTIQVLKQLHIRYAGTDSTIAVNLSDPATIKQQFENSYQQQYGITLPNKKLIVATIATEAIGSTAQPSTKQKQEEEQEQTLATSQPTPESITTVSVFSSGQWHQTPVFQREHLLPSQPIKGPAIILEKTGTNIIEPGWTADVDATGALILQREVTKQSTSQKLSSPAQQHKPDPIKLEIFNNLFQSIAEQMGFTLQNTSSSVNIKERLDFSCAIFDAAGQLVANAPHIPVHLGSMGESVTALIHSIPTFHPGDTYISNNPYNGGTHLPDITAITPVFIENNIPNSTSNNTPNSPQPLFFVASRGHHADIGGITPGSMPPHSTHLTQEGILFDNFQLVNAGTLRLTELNKHLSNGPHPARNPQQNLADLQAQIAANNKGTQELHRMVQQFGLGTVQAYMQHVQDNAEQAVRRAIDQLCQQHSQPHSSTPLSCRVPMDCGATVSVTVTLDPTQRSATLDFTDTSAQQPNNFNAPLAVCKAAVLYVFRTLVDSPIPLNAGCLKPLNILVPSGSLLNPSYPAAVVAGNVETSQAITDALYGALGVLAASQGTMNNFTFGNERYQYYETICGGSGAGPQFHGTSAVQTHMTNSRLTDPEVLELRFPVVLESFAIRQGSGGKGQYYGGDGVVRRLRFQANMTASLLSGRRRTQPFGLGGGQQAQSGITEIVRQDAPAERLEATASVEVQPGDVIVVSTPGGGGYGPLATSH